MNDKAPIVLFTFNRPEHTRSTLESLVQNPEFSASPLFIYCDGERNDTEAAQVQQTRELVRNWPHSQKTVIERDRNWGLADSIIDGVTHLCETFGRVIVMEDDLVVSPHFLNYMNQGLLKYQEENKVISIHGYVYPVEHPLPETFFLKGTDCWGWATWQRGWDLFETDGQKLLAELKNRALTRDFDFEGSYPYTRMLQKQIEGKNNSWAIRWYASAFLKDKLTLYPGRSLVHNIGLDASGEHCSSMGDFASTVAMAPIMVEDVAIEESLSARKLFVEFHKRTRSSLITRINRRLVTVMQRLNSGK